MEKLIEFDPRQYETYDADGFPTIDAPPELENLWGDGDRRCARGVHCVAPQYGGAHIVGMLLHEDDDNPARSGLYWNTCFYLETVPHVLFCEDCLTVIEDEEEGETILEGNDGEVHWFIDLMGRSYTDPFGPWVATFDATHGISWEKELGTCGTFSEAVDVVEHWMGVKAAEDAKLEAQLDEAFADEAVDSDPTPPYGIERL
jgi:hypothetical protein